MQNELFKSCMLSGLDQIRNGGGVLRLIANDPM